jgi:hypothetical protein
MAAIYDQHDKAFQHVSAYVVLWQGARVATVAFKLPRDGAGRLYAYVHWVGTAMVRGHASGYGYDKRTAACASAARSLPDDITGRDAVEGRAAFIDALSQDTGYSWDRQLEKAGFTVLQAV